ncbi:MAG: tetratricopeptide repeat protein [Planctomycetota bacterium]
MKRAWIAAALIITAAAATLILYARPGDPRTVLQDALRGLPDAGRPGGTIIYPRDGTVFPPGLPAPRMWWEPAGCDLWAVRMEIPGAATRLIMAGPETAEWIVDAAAWAAVQDAPRETDIVLTVAGARREHPADIRMTASIRFRIASAAITDTLFFREVPLPFSDAVKDPGRIRWRFGPVTAPEPPPVVLENLPVCGNCHSFSADGAVLGMDVDYANDKGSYAILPVAREMTLARSRIITWSDFRREDGDLTFGLLSRISPDGRYAVSTVKDRSVFVPRPDLMYSQLFFPVKGILAFHDRQTGEFKPLPGADDPAFVHSNPCWSPDGKELVFTRAPAYILPHLTGDARALLSPEECAEFLTGGREFKFDLCRIPWNDGAGGTAVPMPGASANGMSNYFPRFSPDGRWIVFCRAKSFMLLQGDSELWIMPAAGGTPRRMNGNTPRMNSWHSWSSDSRWLVFATKWLGPYTRLAMTRVDADGNDTPPVLLEHLTAPDRAANIPEFVPLPAGAIARIREDFVDDISWVRAAMNCRKVGDLAGAIRNLDRALAINPANDQAHNERGYALEQQGDLAGALGHYRTAVRLRSGGVEAANNIGIVLRKLGRFDEAAEHYRAAIAAHPDRAELYYNLGLVHGARQDAAAAAVWYIRALDVRPDYPEAHNNLGLAYMTLGRRDDAVAQFRAALRLKPGFREARANLEGVLGPGAE